MRSVSDRFLSTVGASHRVSVSNLLLDPNGDVVELAPTGGRVDLDGTDSALIRGRLTMTFAAHGDAVELYEQLAPFGAEIQVARGIEYPDGTTERVPQGVFRIEDPALNDQRAITLNAFDRSKRISDAKLEEASSIAQGTPFGEAILGLLQGAWSEVPYNADEFESVTGTTPLLALAEQDDPWDSARKLARAIALDLYFDGEGEARLRPINAETSAVAEVVEGDGGLLLSIDRARTRQNAVNRVKVTGENTTTGAIYEGIATDETSRINYYTGALPLFYSSPYIASDEQAADAAAGLLARRMGISEAVSFGSLVHPALEPGDPIRVRREEIGVDSDLVIDTLTIPLEHDQPMTGATREVQVIQ